MLVDHFSGKPWRTPPKRQPIMTPDPTWTIDKIRLVQTEHEQGYFYRSSRMGDWMMRDGRLATVMETRIKGLLGLPFRIEPADETPTRAEAKAAKALLALWPSIMPETVTAEVLENLVKHGFCLCQVLWQDRPGAATRWVPRLRVWDTGSCYYDSWAQRWVILHATGQEPITPGDGNWVLFSFRDSSPWMAGLVRQLPIPVLIRSFSWSDWSNFNETLGQSFLKGIVPAWANKSEDDEVSGTPSKDTFLEQIQGLGRDNRYILCEEGSDTSKFDAKYESPAGEGAASFETAQASASTEITTRVLGQNLTTEIKGSSSYAAEKGHEDVRQDYKEGDAETIASDLRGQLLRPWAHYAYGDPELAPWAYFDPTPPEDRKVEAETLKNLADSLGALQAAAQGSGRRVDIEALFERFNVPTLAGEKETQEPAAPETEEERMLRNMVPWRRRQMLRGQYEPGQRRHPQEVTR